MKLTEPQKHELRDFTLFLLKDKKFSLDEKGVALLDEEYEKVSNLVLAHFCRKPSKADATKTGIKSSPVAPKRK